MAALLRNALDRDEFHLVYQPKLELATGRISGVEALLRWRSAELGLVSPADFIPLAEELGLIVPIGEWVLRHACMQAKTWIDIGLPPLTLAVNLSPRQLREADLVDRIAEVLRDTGWPAELLELEITEGVIMDNVKGNIDALMAMRRLGASLAIDDFGTGYSSLAYLTRLPIQTLKIDRAFVSSMLDDASALTLVSTIITLAHSLNLKVVAEGVETLEQQRLLQRLSCDQMQGYYFSRPIAAGALEALVRDGTGSSRERRSVDRARRFAGALRLVHAA
jgi:EAL domain-containing protein (putative c-di-GMP-specific phosphodiesterase class I)